MTGASYDTEALMSVAELLIRAGLITPENIEDNIAMSKTMHQPVTKVLDMLGILKLTTMDAAILIQSMIDEEKIALDRAVKAMELVGKRGLDVQTALRKVTQGIEKKGEKVTHFLGELLRKAGLITQRQLEEGISQSLNTGLPLGMVLIGMSAVTPALLNSTLMTERLIRENVVSQDQGIQALRAARLHHVTLIESLREHNFADIKPQVGLGQLFVLAGMLTEGQLMSALEIELAREQPLDAVLLEYGYVNQIGITAGHQCLQIISDGMLAADQAAHILKKLKSATTSEEMVQVLSTIGMPEDEEVEAVETISLLQWTGLVTEKDIEIGTPLALDQRVPLTKVFENYGRVNPTTMSAVEEVKAHVDSGLLTLEQAIIVIVYCQENECSAPDAMTLFGWLPTLKE